jgi:hypothetical protein
MAPTLPLLIVAQQWPSWLVVALANDLPITGAYFPAHLHRHFKAKPGLTWYDSYDLPHHRPSVECIGLVSGCIEFIKRMKPSLPSARRCIFIVEPPLRGYRSFGALQAVQRDAASFLKNDLGLPYMSLKHSAFGGCTSGKHLCAFGDIVCSADTLPSVPPNVKRTLAGAVSPSVEGHFPSCPPPSSFVSKKNGVFLTAYGGSTAVSVDGLFPCHSPMSRVMCPSVYGSTPNTYVVRELTLKELLNVYCIPSPYHETLLSTYNSVKDVLPFESAISSDILMSLAQQLWGVNIDGGVEESASRSAVSLDADYSQSSSVICVHTPHVTESEDAVVTVDVLPESEDAVVTEDVLHTSNCDDDAGANVVISTALVEEDVKKDLEVAVDSVRFGEEDVEVSMEKNNDDVNRDASITGLTREMVDVLRVEAEENLREAKENKKAAKADDAEVPVKVWNDVIKEGSNPRDDLGEERFRQAADVLREWGLKRFWKKLRSDCIKRLRKNHGKDWSTLPRKKKNGQPTRLGVEIHALSSIMWHATEGSWFEYHSGSALHYFRFPLFYQGIARDGVPVFFEKDGPTSMRRQTPIADEKARAVLRDKLKKVIKRGYLFGSGIKLRSLIRYFAVPKTDTDYRVVYDATANKLNDAVWAPSFWLPTIDTLVRYVDADTWMMDRDVGDMFLNFPLDKRVWPYTGLHLADLFDGTSEEDAEILKKAGSEWAHWGRCLMGFKPSPYNSIKTAMVVEEVAKGDRHCERNPFQWDHIRLNLPGNANYDPSLSWISKLRKDGLIACDIFTFVDDERLIGATRELSWQAGHKLAYIQAYLGVQDAARKVRPCNRQGGAWAGAVLHTIPEVGVCVLTSEEKWKRFKGIIEKWLGRLEQGEDELDHKELQSDRGFCVHLCSSYPSMRPFLKGFHLTLEMWRGNRDAEGWKLPESSIPGDTLSTIEEGDDDMSWTDDEDDDSSLEDEYTSVEDEVMLEFKLKRELELDVVKDSSTAEDSTMSTDFSMTDVADALDDDDEPPPVDILRSPPSGYTTPAGRFIHDLRALHQLSSSDTPPLRVVRSKVVLTAFYGFGDASGKGFCGTVGYHEQVAYRIGVWGRDEESTSSNYKELRNLVETCEEEAAAGRLFNAEFFLFTDNSTAEACFYRGSSTSKLLHELIVRLRKLEVDYNLTIHVIHVSGDRMIAQGTDGGSRGSLLEGVLSGKPMLDFVDLGKTALERYPPLLDWIKKWTNRPSLEPLTPEEWYVEAHGVCGGDLNEDGIWMPHHEKPNSLHLWAPPPAVADAALEELLKARHKRTDTYHVVVIPRLMTPRWRRLYRKVCDFTCQIPAGSSHWPANMYEPLWLGIVLPFTHHRPWQLKRAPLLLGMERDMRRVLREGQADGGDILRKLLQLNSRLRKVPKNVARILLQMPRE